MKLHEFKLSQILQLSGVGGGGGLVGIRHEWPVTTLRIQSIRLTMFISFFYRTRSNLRG